MIVDFTAQTAPLLWAIIAAFLILALVLFACIEPELAEVYLGDVQLLVATLALAAIAIVLLSARIADAAPARHSRAGPLSAVSAGGICASSMRRSTIVKLERIPWHRCATPVDAAALRRQLEAEGFDGVELDRSTRRRLPAALARSRREPVGGRR